MSLFLFGAGGRHYPNSRTWLKYILKFHLSLHGPQIKMTNYICEEQLRPESLKRLTLVDVSPSHHNCTILFRHSVNLFRHCFVHQLQCWATTLWYYVKSLALTWVIARWLIFCLLSIIPRLKGRRRQLLTARLKAKSSGSVLVRLSRELEAPAPIWIFHILRFNKTK